jgi:hypothetical protein
VVVGFTGLVVALVVLVAGRRSLFTTSAALISPTVACVIYMNLAQQALEGRQAGSAC